MDRDVLNRCSSQELTDAIEQLHALRSVALTQLLELIDVFEATEAYRKDGANAMAPWLVGQLGIAHRSAWRWVEMARALRSLPAISAVAGEGRLCEDQLAPLCRLATPETDVELAEEAPSMTVAALEAAARRARALDPDDEAEAHRRRSLTWRWDRDQGWLRLHGRLAGEDGAKVVEAIERLAAEAPAGPDGVYDPYPSRCADALVALASASLAADTDADRATVVVHAPAAALRGEGRRPAWSGPACPFRAPPWSDWPAMPVSSCWPRTTTAAP